MADKQSFPKLCPLLFTSEQMAWQHRADHGVEPGKHHVDCLQGSCGWWVPSEGACALRVIAERSA